MLFLGSNGRALIFNCESRMIWERNSHWQKAHLSSITWTWATFLQPIYLKNAFNIILSEVMWPKSFQGFHFKLCMLFLLSNQCYILAYLLSLAILIVIICVWWRVQIYEAPHYEICPFSFSLSVLGVQVGNHYQKGNCGKTAWSEAWTVFALKNTGVVGSIPTQGMDYSKHGYLCLFRVCSALFVGSGLATGRVLPSVYGIKKLKKRPRPNNGL
jgi:hypothetical protein